MGGSESSEVSIESWEEFKKSPTDQTVQILLTACKNWNTFTATVTSKDIRTYFETNIESFLYLVSYVFYIIIHRL